MSVRTYVDNNGLEYKHVPLDQYDSYDYDLMLKRFTLYDKRIGSLLMVFSELEHTLDKAIAFMLSERSDDLGIRISMDMSYRQKIELYYRLSKIHLKYLNKKVKKNESEKIKIFIESFKSAGRIRNIIAHAKWMSLDKDGFVRSKASLDDDAFIQHRYYKLTPFVLYRLERRINKTENDFYAYLDAKGII